MTSLSSVNTMNPKMRSVFYGFFFTFFLSFPFLLLEAKKRPLEILDESSSGLLLMIDAGSGIGLKPREAVLIRRDNEKLAAARVVRLFDNRSAVYVVSRYSRDKPSAHDRDSSYNLLYGIPLLNVPDLPPGVDYSILDDLEMNPQDTDFFAGEGREKEPEIDDDTYIPSGTVTPKLPSRVQHKGHNISAGIGLFRNLDLATAVVRREEVLSSYGGYLIRYSYNFPSFYWLRGKIPFIGSIEISLGSYSFNFTHVRRDGARFESKVEVLPISTYFVYKQEVNPLVLLHAYIGYQHNIVASNDPAPVEDLENLKGSSLEVGLGASMVVSKYVDVRADIGTNGSFVSAVMKF